MSSENVKLKLSKGSRITRCESEKSYNLKYANYMVFVPKKVCEMETLDIKEGLYRWRITIPLWLLNKNEDLRIVVNHLKREENEKN